MKSGKKIQAWENLEPCFDLSTKHVPYYGRKCKKKQGGLFYFHVFLLLFFLAKSIYLFIFPVLSYQDIIAILNGLV
jgi:hypothetical protein